MQDFIRVRVEVEANGEYVSQTITEPLRVGGMIPVEIATVAAEAGARAQFLRTMRTQGVDKIIHLDRT